MFRFSQLVRRQQAPSGTVTPEATLGAGLQLTALPARRPTEENERGFSSGWVELTGPNGSIGTFLVSAGLGEPQEFEFQGKPYTIELRDRRFYKNFSLKLLDFRFDRYAGTQIARNYSSLVQLVDPGRNVNRQVLIWMNHPLRHGGFAFFQHSFGNDETSTTLQVVQNPSWLLPYISCVVVGLGMLVQFGIHLTGFIRRRRMESVAAQPAPAR
jgi:hypothetical protein